MKISDLKFYESEETKIPAYLMMPATKLSAEVPEGVSNRSYVDEYGVPHIRTWKTWRDFTHNITYSLDSLTVNFGANSFGEDITFAELKIIEADADIEVFTQELFPYHNQVGWNPNADPETLLPIFKAALITEMTGSYYEKSYGDYNFFVTLRPGQNYSVTKPMLYLHFLAETRLQFWHKTSGVRKAFDISQDGAKFVNKEITQAGSAQSFTANVAHTEAIQAETSYANLLDYDFTVAIVDDGVSCKILWHIDLDISSYCTAV